VELKEFVRDVLVQIAEGVREADAGVSAAGGVASPATHFGPVANAREIHFATMDTGAPVFLVDFDVAITVAEGSSVGGDARLRIATIFSAGIGAKGGGAVGRDHRAWRGDLAPVRAIATKNPAEAGLVLGWNRLLLAARKSQPEHTSTEESERRRLRHSRCREGGILKKWMAKSRAIPRKHPIEIGGPCANHVDLQSVAYKQ
jgi:hypothetical protein